MMSAKNKNIDSLQALETYNAELEKNIFLGEAKIKSAGRNLVEKRPIEFTKTILKTGVDKRLEQIKDPRRKLLPDLAASMLRNTVLRKAGFINRWLISLSARYLIKNALQPKNTVPLTKIVSPSPTQSPLQPTFLSHNDIAHDKNNSKADIGKHGKLSIKGILGVLKVSFTGFGDHKITKMSGSLAYYTVFSMGPLLVVIIALCAIFMEKEAAQGKIFDQLKGFLGSETAMQLQEMIKSAGIGDKGSIAFIIGLGTLLIGATSIFADIQDSINTIWGIKPKPKRGWLKMLQNRFLSFSVIISLGFLLLVSLAVTAVLDGFSDRLQTRFEDVSVIFFYILNTGITLIVISSIFGVIFKVLPDANIKWKDVISGALVTAVLFMIGKFAISVYISKSDIGGTYGAAGSLIILLLWTYYSSIILYFGAEFTKAYAIAYGSEIHPNHYAVTIKEVEVEQDNSSVQEIDSRT
ncbi:YihY/virulence factor BrkB family protein [Pedobacter agri]|uniref:YihY/virulence factor BrkB family protein n=1 Tax=Pedobacter agri TaxID=454586 RepID=A0A9X3IBW2_9SPHI|nr:YihY/virulence factor BrkB family protein [Pedobacter agri]MCX3267524.1 YihY/virulence factor BrkB family protein [Pedobacter agri]